MKTVIKSALFGAAVGFCTSFDWRLGLALFFYGVSTYISFGQ